MNITRKDINTLRDNTWINDQIINFYLNLIAERSKEANHLPKVYVMNTFFVPRLQDKGYNAVSRWTRKVDIFAFDIILIPIHINQNHWCIATVDLGNKTIKYYDSLGGTNDQVIRILSEYLEKESLDKRNQIFDITPFTRVNIKDAPKQDNRSDCGIFSCKIAEYITKNAELNFTQKDIPQFRQKMILEILNGKLF